MAIVVLIAAGTGIVALAPTAEEASAPPSQAAVATPGPSHSPAPPPASSAPSAIASAASPAVSGPPVDPSAIATSIVVDPDPTPTRTPRPPVDKPDPTPTKTPKPPTNPPTTTPPVTATPLPSIVPARVTNHANGSVLHGSSVTFEWSTATGGAIRFYGLYVGTSAPPQPCGSGFCEDPPDNPNASSSIACKCGLDSGTTSVEVTNLPADGSTIYVRLFTKYQPESGRYTWRDYTFTSAP